MTALPAVFISALNKSATSGTQPPQPVPALRALLDGRRAFEPLSRMAAQIALC